MPRRKLQLLVCILAWFRPAKCVGGRSYYPSWGGGFKNSLPRSSPADGLHGSCKNVCRGGRFLICLNGCRRPSSSALTRNALLPSRHKSTDLRALSFQNGLLVRPLCSHNAPRSPSLFRRIWRSAGTRADAEEWLRRTEKPGSNMFWKIDPASVCMAYYQERIAPKSPQKHRPKSALLSEQIVNQVFKFA